MTKKVLWYVGLALLCVAMIAVVYAAADNRLGRATVSSSVSNTVPAGTDPATIQNLWGASVNATEKAAPSILGEAVKSDKPLPDPTMLKNKMIAARKDMGSLARTPSATSGREAGRPLDQGGEDCVTATIVPGLPYSDAGTTVGYLDDYEEVCPWNAPGSPDVVYMYTPTADIDVTISLCGNSDYDTKLYVYEGGCPGTLVGCNDDFCSTPSYPSEFVSYLECVPMVVPNTYFIVVDGYGGDAGNYTIDMEECVPCVVECQPGDVLEPFEDPADPNFCPNDPDGGCNNDDCGGTNLFGAVECGQTICGKGFTYLYTGLNYRDTDWYVFTLAQPETIEVTLIAEFNVRFFLLTNDCNNLVQLLTGTIALPCTEQSFRTTGTLAAGEYILWIGPNVFDGIPEPAEYRVTLDCISAECLPAEDVTVYRGVGPTDQVNIRFWAPQGGKYAVYRTADPNNDGDPDNGADPDWSLLTLLENVPPLAYTTYTDSPLAPYYNYVIIHDCTVPCADFELTAPGSMTGNTSGAGDNCALNVGEEQMIEVTIPNDGEWTFSLCDGGTTYDSWLDLYTECCGGTLLAFNDDYCGAQSELHCIPLTAGVYYLAVEGWSANVGAWSLDITECVPCVPLPPHDNCENAVAVAAFPFTETNTTLCATQQCLSYGTSDDVWYTFTTTEVCNLEINFCGSATVFNTVRVVLEQQCPCNSALWIFPTTTEWASCGDGNPTMTYNGLPAGTYWYAVYSTDLQTGPYTISIDCTPPPPCIPDFTVTAPAADLVGNISGAGDDCQLDAGEEHIYLVTIPNDGEWTFSLCDGGTDYDSYLNLYTGCCSGLIASNDDYCGLQSQIDCVPLVAGTYYLMVEGYSLNVGNYSLDIYECVPCILECPPGATLEGEPCPNIPDNFNGGCNSTPNIFSTITCGETVCGTSEAGQFTPGNRDTDWYQYVSTEPFIFTWTVTAEFNVLSFVIDGTGGCGAYTILAQATAVECQPATIVTNCLPAGTYWFWVGPQVFDGVPCGDYVATLSCEPCEADPYCAASGGCDEYISNVQFVTINNASGCTNYGNYTAISTTVDDGVGNTITVSNGNAYTSDECDVWVDWNNNNSFLDAGEYLLLSSADGDWTYTGTITAPAGSEGSHRMRIRIRYFGIVDPCGTAGQSYGEVEDYTVIVQ